MKVALTPGNGLPTQVGVPVARLSVQRKLLRGQSMGFEDFWVCTACIQNGKPQRTGLWTLSD